MITIIPATDEDMGAWDAAKGVQYLLFTDYYDISASILDE
jgi:hypothetical protein